MRADRPARRPAGPAHGPQPAGHAARRAQNPVPSQGPRSRRGPRRHGRRRAPPRLRALRASRAARRPRLPLDGAAVGHRRRPDGRELDPQRRHRRRLPPHRIPLPPARARSPAWNTPVPTRRPNGSGNSPPTPRCTKPTDACRDRSGPDPTARRRRLRGLGLGSLAAGHFRLRWLPGPRSTCPSPSERRNPRVGTTPAPEPAVQRRRRGDVRLSRAPRERHRPRSHRHPGVVGPDRPDRRGGGPVRRRRLRGARPRPLRRPYDSRQRRRGTARHRAAHAPGRARTLRRRRLLARPRGRTGRRRGRRGLLHGRRLRPRPRRGGGEDRGGRPLLRRGRRRRGGLRADRPMSWATTASWTRTPHRLAPRRSPRASGPSPGRR